PDVDQIKVIVLVPIGVLDVKKLVRFIRPKIGANPALRISGQDVILILTDNTEPNLKDVFHIRRNISEVAAIGGKLRAQLFGIAEQNFARDQRNRRWRGSMIDSHALIILNSPPG